MDQQRAANIAFFVAPLLLALTACSNEQEISFKSGGMTHTFAQGKAAIPKDFERLIYPEALTTGSVSAAGDSDQEQSKFLMLSSNDPSEGISKWYQDQLKASGWSVDKVEDERKIVSISGHKANQEINAMIEREGSKTNISLSIDKQVESANEEKDASENYTPDKVTPPTD